MGAVVGRTVADPNPLHQRVGLIVSDPFREPGPCSSLEKLCLAKEPKPMRYLALLMLAGALGACRLTGDEACAIQAAEPLVTVDAVADSASGAEIPVILVSNVRYSGFPLLPASLVDPQRAPVRQATVDGDAIRCVVICGFGSNEGRYEVTIAAPGYRSRTITFSAEYDRLDAGCPRLQRDGVTLSLTLTKL